MKARKRKKPKRKPLPEGYGTMDTSGMQSASGAGAMGTGIGTLIGGGLGAAASAASFGTLAPILIPAGMAAGGALGGAIGSGMEAEAEAAFAAEQAAKDAAFAMQQFEYQQARDEYEYADAVHRQNVANAVKDTPRLESMNVLPQYRRGR